MPNFLSMLTAKVDLVKSLASAGWEYVKPTKPPEPRKQPESIKRLFARERKEIRDSRAVRMADIESRIDAEVGRIKEMFHTRAKSAAAGVDKGSGVADASQVYEVERDERGRKRVFQPMKNEVKNNCVGVCYSGGGIRSATFNLGVTTGLAKKGYLKQVDYLSTVSGGGYIGSWLCAWAKRAQYKDDKGVPDPKRRGILEVEQVLAENSFGSGGRYLEPNPVRFLRKYSNYLAPRTGLLSTDLWALIAVYLRNVMLNVALLIATGALVLDLPLLGVRYGWAVAGVDLRGALLNATRILLIIAMGAIAYSFASFSSDVQPKFKLARSIADRPGVWVVLPLLAAAGLMTYVLTSNLGQKLHALLGHTPATVGSAPEVSWLWQHMPSFIAGSAIFQWLSSLPGKSGHPEMTGWVMEGAFWYTGIWMLGNFAARMFEVLAGWDWKLRTFLGLNWKTLFGRGRGPKPVSKSALLGGSVSLVAALISGALGGLLLYAFGQLLAKLPYGLWPSLHGGAGFVQVYANVAMWIILGPPLLLWTVALVSVLHVGLLGRSLPDAKREWLSRLCAMLALTAAVWAVMMGLSLYGAVVFKFLFLSSWAATTWGRILKWLVASGWLAATVGGVIGGNKSKTKPQGGNESGSFLLKLAPPVFILGLLLMLSWGVDWYLSTTPVDPNALVSTAGPAAEQYRAMISNASSAGNMGDFVQRFAEMVKGAAPPTALAAMNQVGNEHWSYAAQYLNPGSVAVWNMFLGLAAIMLLLSWRLDVNEFSIHLLYRNRLARCYLGASRENRTPQPFTGFDLDDDLPVSSLVVNPSLPGIDNNPDIKNPYYGPYHIVCTALNLVSGKDLAWQTRKARSFIYSPFYCGYDFFYAPTPEEVAEQSGQKVKLANSAYRRTNWFSGYPGPYIGTALAISGAAATPNMGYHSSPALTFLMTVFNVRLGWWAGNSRHNVTWQFSGPRLMLYLLKELFGHTDDESRFVYLSDGGHFENLGLYELVRRKCRYIIASDGGCDPDYAFGDLGNAIQKCRRDLGAEILIDVSKLRPKEGDRFCEQHYAVGKIKYSDLTEGTLVYLKSSLTKNDRRDVQSFAEEDGTFPHDSTADQFFNETRFESFRTLGEDVFTSLVNDVTDRLGQHPVTLAGLFTALEEIYTSSTPTRRGKFDLDEVQVAKMKLSFETE